MRSLLFALIIAASLSAAACGGSSDGPSGPPQAAFTETSLTPDAKFPITALARLERWLTPRAAWAQVADTFTFTAPAATCTPPAFCGVMLNVEVQNVGPVAIGAVRLTATIDGFVAIENRLLDPVDPRYCWPVTSPTRPAGWWGPGGETTTSPPGWQLTGVGPLEPGQCSWPNTPPVEWFVEPSASFPRGISAPVGTCADLDGIRYCVIDEPAGGGGPGGGPGAIILRGSFGDSAWTRFVGPRPFHLTVSTSGLVLAVRDLLLVVQ